MSDSAPEPHRPAGAGDPSPATRPQPGAAARPVALSLATVRPPAAAPCKTCPYRIDVPSGVWDSSQYDMLPRYDGDLVTQPPNLFACHSGDGRLCAGWVGCHGGDNLLSVRLAARRMPDAVVRAVMAYRTSVPLFPSGAAAAAHGLRDIDAPGLAARAAVARLLAKRADLR